MYFKPSWISKSALFVLQLCGKKEKHFVTKKRPKNRIFPKGVTRAFGPKNVNFFFIWFLVVVLLNDFLERKETFLSIRKNNFSKSKKSSFFFKGVNPLLLAKKCHFFSLLDLIKITLQIMLSDFAEKKETFSTLKNSIFKVQKIAFFQRG